VRSRADVLAGLRQVAETARTRRESRRRGRSRSRTWGGSRRCSRWACPSCPRASCPRPGWAAGAAPPPPAALAAPRHRGVLSSVNWLAASLRVVAERPDERPVTPRSLPSLGLELGAQARRAGKHDLPVLVQQQDVTPVAAGPRGRERGALPSAPCPRYCAKAGSEGPVGRTSVGERPGRSRRSCPRIEISPVAAQLQRRALAVQRVARALHEVLGRIPACHRRRGPSGSTGSSRRGSRIVEKDQARGSNPPGAGSTVGSWIVLAV
jgi:hypothetical protein